MAAYKAANYTDVAHNGEYGSLSNTVRSGTFAASMAAASTIDLCVLPGGAEIVSGYLVMTTAITTATFHVGVRYADGTSTGGTTGTAVISGTGVVSPVANVQAAFPFKPFTNDVDTIAYISFANGAAVTAIPYAVSLNYKATGTK